MEVKVGVKYITRGGWFATVDSIDEMKRVIVSHHGNGSGWFHFIDGTIATSNRDFDMVREA